MAFVLLIQYQFASCSLDADLFLFANRCRLSIILSGEKGFNDSLSVIIEYTRKFPKVSRPSWRTYMEATFAFLKGAIEVTFLPDYLSSHLSPGAAKENIAMSRLFSQVCKHGACHYECHENSVLNPSLRPRLNWIRLFTFYTPLPNERIFFTIKEPLS